LIDGQTRSHQHWFECSRSIYSRRFSTCGLRQLTALAQNQAHFMHIAWVLPRRVRAAVGTLYFKKRRAGPLSCTNKTPHVLGLQGAGFLSCRNRQGRFTNTVSDNDEFL
jgi:hypothetical protein